MYRAIYIGAAAVLCLSAAFAQPFGKGAARAAQPYPLYFAFEIPPVVTGYEQNEQQEQHAIYTGLLRGTLGGLPIQRSTLTLRPGASTLVGGGDFSLQTSAGVLTNGLILMTGDKQQTSMWFSGLYLGEHLAFHVTGPANFATGSFAAKGLADTSFADHSSYLAAIRQAVANLAPAARAQALADADRNISLVGAYRQETGTP